jgi:hypothetical protein
MAKFACVQYMHLIKLAKFNKIKAAFVFYSVVDVLAQLVEQQTTAIQNVMQ